VTQRNAHILEKTNTSNGSKSQNLAGILRGKEYTSASVPLNVNVYSDELFVFQAKKELPPDFLDFCVVCLLAKSHWYEYDKILITLLKVSQLYLVIKFPC
jgi:hypothetical protein